MRRNQCPWNRQQDRENTKTGNGEKNAELCRMSCCAVAWRAGRERRADSWRRGGHSSRSDNAMRRMDIGFWKPGFQVVSVCPPRSPGRFLAPSGTGLVTSSNRTDSAAVHRSMAAPIPPHHHISMEAKLFSDRESGGELAGSCIFCRAFSWLSFNGRGGLLFQHCVSMHVIFCGGTPLPKLYSAALAIVSLEMC